MGATGDVELVDRGVLRLLTCGSVDDGKSTLIGRLLYEAGVVPDDQLTALARDSRRFGTTGSDLDFALLVDGLEAERQQGITIDVAYRFFATQRRSFIIADTPGHEQYTRNMATGASTSSLAILLVDVRKGLLPQTKRHSYICSLFGIRHVVLAVNKMDLVDFSELRFHRIVEEYRAFAKALEFTSVIAIPICARDGSNITKPSLSTDWYQGPQLLDCLESVDVDTARKTLPFRMHVQWVNRPNGDFRGLSGTVASGVVRPKDEVLVASTGYLSRIAEIVTVDGRLQEAHAGEAVTLVLEDNVDVARGDMLASAVDRPQTADQFAAHLLWMSTSPMMPGRSYAMRIGTKWLQASITAIKHHVDVNTLDHRAARTLNLNEIGVVNISMATPAPFDSYKENHATGSFILVDRQNDQTVAAGMIDFALRRATNIHHEHLLIGKEQRGRLMRQRPTILWLTGLSGSGKSTIAKLVEHELFTRGHHTYLLDGDNLRHGLNKDIGFTPADRVENVRRAGEVAKLFVDAGLIVICAFISPYEAERRMVRELFDADEFVEIFVDTPIEECMRRDPKGLYAKARGGGIKNFTGLDSPYEPPSRPEIHVRTVGRTADQLASVILDYLGSRLTSFTVGSSDEAG